MSDLIELIIDILCALLGIERTKKEQPATPTTPSTPSTPTVPSTPTTPTTPTTPVQPAQPTNPGTGADPVTPTPVGPTVWTGLKQTYRIKVDKGSAFASWQPGQSALVNPYILDTDGFENTSIPQNNPAVDQSRGYKSVLQWTKDKWGSANDPLGLIGWYSWARSFGGLTQSIGIVYDYTTTGTSTYRPNVSDLPRQAAGFFNGHDVDWSRASDIAFHARENSSGYFAVWAVDQLDPTDQTVYMQCFNNPSHPQPKTLYTQSKPSQPAPSQPAQPSAPSPCSGLMDRYNSLLSRTSGRIMTASEEAEYRSLVQQINAARC